MDTRTISAATFTLLWQQGKSVDEIATIAHRAKSTIHKRARALGLSKGHLRWDYSAIESVLDLRAQGKSFGEIAREKGVSRCAIAGVCFRFQLTSTGLAPDKHQTSPA